MKIVKDSTGYVTTFDHQRLISAAPDLYAACEALCSHYDGSKLNHAINLAGNALRKARGEK